jgi:hypothetical protein
MRSRTDARAIGSKLGLLRYFGTPEAATLSSLEASRDEGHLSSPMTESQNTEFFYVQVIFLWSKDIKVDSFSMHIQSMTNDRKKPNFETIQMNANSKVISNKHCASVEFSSTCPYRTFCGYTPPSLS